MNGEAIREDTQGVHGVLGADDGLGGDLGVLGVGDGDGHGDSFRKMQKSKCKMQNQGTEELDYEGEVMEAS
jgi:hypothetical protein